MEKKIKIFADYKWLKRIIVAIAAIALIFIVVVVYRDNRGKMLKNNIHYELWEIFEGENINIAEGDIKYKDNSSYAYDPSNMIDVFSYNEIGYFFSYSFIDKELVDTSQILAEVRRYDDESKMAKVYRIKDTPEDYILAVEIEGVYYRYYGVIREEHNSLEEYIDIRGGKEKLNVEYVEVILLEGEQTTAQYVYVEGIDEWVWNLLLGNRHNFEGWIPSESTAGGEYVDYPDRHVRFNICIRNNAANAVYKLYILPNGNLALCDGKISGGEAEYTFSASELIDACKTLVNDYTAYKVD